MVNTLNPIKNPTARFFLDLITVSSITGSLEIRDGSTEDGNKLKICLSKVRCSSTFK